MNAPVAPASAGQQRFSGNGSFLDVFEEAPIPYHEVDAAGAILRVNRAECELLGLDASEMVGRPVWNFTGDPEESREHFFRKIRGEESLAPYEHCRVRPDGKALTLQVHENFIRDRLGAVAGIRTTLLDVTERKRREESLVRLAAELARSNAELEQFAYVASHDLQEPLRMVASYTQLLARRYKGRLDADADEFIAFAVDGANRMQHLINDLLAYSRVGRRGGTVRLLDTEDSLARVLADLHARIVETGAEVICGPLPRLYADPVEFSQLLQNLVSNAIKFHDSRHPRVHVSAARCGAAWQFLVEDNGIGLDPSYYERIFHIFQRLHTREEYPGTGIGLAICKKIVERRGGRIWVESEPGRGSRFYFTVPDRSEGDPL